MPRYVLSVMKMIDFALDPSLGPETYVLSSPMVSTVPTGVPSWTLPEMQHGLSPTPVDMAGKEAMKLIAV